MTSSLDIIFLVFSLLLFTASGLIVQRDRGMRLSEPSPSKIVPDIAVFFFKFTGAGFVLLVFGGAGFVLLILGGDFAAGRSVDDISGAIGRVSGLEMAGLLDSWKMLVPVEVTFEFGDTLLFSVGGGLLRGEGAALVLI